MRKLPQITGFTGYLSFLLLPFYLLRMFKKFGDNGIMRVQITKPLRKIDEDFILCTKKHYYRLLNEALTGTVKIKL